MTRRHRALDEFRFRAPIEVRFRDTDSLGHVNNAVYLTYFEAARAGYYRAVTGRTFGFGAAAQAETFVIAEARVAFRAPAYFGETLDVACRAHWAGRSSFGIEYLIRARDSEIGAARDVADGETVQVMYDFAARRVSRIPPGLLGMFERYEGRPVPGGKSEGR